MPIYRIPEENLGNLKKKIEKLNRRAAKLACEPINFQVHGTEMVKVNPQTEELMRVYVVEVEGQAPKLAGWTFVATLMEVPEVGSIIKAVPGFEVPAKYREAINWCDHCKTSRNRKETFVVMNEQGETKQVGRNCLRDFLGHQSPEVIAEWATLIQELDDLVGTYMSGGSSSRYFSLEKFLSYVVAVIKVRGWASRKYANAWNQASTPDVAVREMFPNKGYKPEIHPTYEDELVAENVVAWAKEIEAEDSDYIHNLKMVAHMEGIDFRAVGLAASMVPAYYRAMGEEFLKAEFGPQYSKDSQYQGEVGKRQTFRVKVVQVRYLEGHYGTTFLYKLVDEHGNLLVWFASKEVLEPNKEQYVNLVATVKAHEEYNGVKQTVLTRCKVA